MTDLAWAQVGVTAYVVILAMVLMSILAHAFGYLGNHLAPFVAQRGSETVFPRHRMNPYSAQVWA